MLKGLSGADEAFTDNSECGYGHVIDIKYKLNCVTCSSYGQRGSQCSGPKTCM